jgi:subtilase family serine protease
MVPALAPGEQFSMGFQLGCSGTESSNVFSVAVDYENSNQEENESNNVLTQAIPCVFRAGVGNSTGIISDSQAAVNGASAIASKK